ncbi:MULTISPECIES: helix-turn-helix domain-containing protein [unclassified Flavobacterium]|uniref:helix-turn-helix domain-containing protein n=1 Tax=unclassified Flavobacterium TaxID=196869 RepID=UPI001E297F2F|nr:MULTISPECIES: helix-turn-helix domain-containing protein [unclassified Flavobacterium]
MENAILLQNLTPRDLEELITRVVKEQLQEFVKNIPTENPDELLTRAEACTLLKINMTTLWNWTKKGKIIAFGIGNRVYYKRGELMGSLIRIN